MIAKYPLPSDREFWDAVIEEAKFIDNAEWEIRFGKGLCFWVRYSPIPIEPGMTMRFYGKGEFYEIRGRVLFDKDNRPWPISYQTPDEYDAFCAERSARLEAEHEARQREPMLPDPQVEGFEWQEGTRQISGFGGAYERACRAMVAAGCKWWSDHPEAEPKFSGFKGIYGIVTEDNEDAKALTAAIVAPTNGDCSGAMHQASVSHVMAWASKFKRDWAAYQDHMKDPTP